MRRMAISAVVGVATLIGSVLAAEAQQIQPTGPLSVVAGSTCSTYTGNVYLPTPCNYVVRLWVMRGTTEVHFSQTVVPNPGVQNSVFTKIAGFNQPIYAGDELIYKIAYKVGTTWYPANYLTTGETVNYGPITVSGTRPTKTIQKSSTLALQTVDRDRRRE
jgi:hypothetical protein